MGAGIDGSGGSGRGLLLSLVSLGVSTAVAIEGQEGSSSKLETGGEGVCCGVTASSLDWCHVVRL